ncbi:hypothetical protein GCM10023238_38030 [Streptomyces heliomycini]
MTNLSYARRMVKAGRMLTPFRSPTIDIDDFYRAAWVQAVAAIDHWLHEEVLRRVAELTLQDSPPCRLSCGGTNCRCTGSRRYGGARSRSPRPS